MGAGPSKPKKKTWWDDFCENCADIWSGFKLRFKKNDNSHHSDASFSPLVPAHHNNDYFESDDDDSWNSPSRQSSFAKVIEKTPEQRVSVIPESSPDNQPAFSPATLSAVQHSEESVKPVTLYRAGIGCWALAGFTSMIALGTGIYPLFAIAGMLAVLGTALLITAYYLNDEKKDGSLSDQAFPQAKGSHAIPCLGYGVGI